MIYDIITTTTFKDGTTYTDEDSIEAPSIEAAIVFATDISDDSPYEPARKDEDEGKITINAKAAVNNKPAYQLKKAAISVDGTYHMITDWDPIWKTQ